MVRWKITCVQRTTKSYQLNQMWFQSIHQSGYEEVLVKGLDIICLPYVVFFSFYVHKCLIIALVASTMNWKNGSLGSHNSFLPLLWKNRNNIRHCMLWLWTQGVDLTKPYCNWLGFVDLTEATLNDRKSRTFRTTSIFNYTLHYIIILPLFLCCCVLVHHVI